MWMSILKIFFWEYFKIRGYTLKDIHDLLGSFQKNIEHMFVLNHLKPFILHLYYRKDFSSIINCAKKYRAKNVTRKFSKTSSIS